MPSTREIRRRIRSVKNIAKVTKAMETVAAAKMRKAQQQVLATRPYAQKSWEVLTHLARLSNTTAAHPLLQKRDGHKVGLLLITADRGLAGAYNSNMIRTAATQIAAWQAEGKEVSLVTVGRKGRDWMARHGPPQKADFTFADLGGRPSAAAIGPVARIVLDEFIAGNFDMVYLGYTNFINTVRQEPVIRQLLPITPATAETPGTADYIFEPSPTAILDELLTGLTELQILQAIYEAIASEESARMVAMRNATDAANDLIADLTLSYNKARQEAITKELLDIVGGANALRQVS